MFAVGTIAVIVGVTAFPSEQTDGNGAPIFLSEIPQGLKALNHWLKQIANGYARRHRGYGAKGDARLRLEHGRSNSMRLMRGVIEMIETPSSIESPPSVTQAKAHSPFA